ncbi:MULTISPECIES: 2TM domain-containing protein [unclassified Flavobacterium]|uniref:2TM domain-containing protein n=1 Tax=unclassified Flavobacterium TaxID=196869 RepID=UPI001F142727|nr:MULTISPECIES: 2TM domain-containing protein [unclassified Flavobacterium]UMY65915.1 2TM domain-containing protein [Flavobacterium sp. HJ-32-4]
MAQMNHELYENARKRIRQKKVLCYHFVLFLVGSLFMYVANELLETADDRVVWYPWTITIWFFLMILHFIKVYIIDRFMNKEWERDQIERLIARQEKKIEQLEARLKREQQA